MNQANDYQQRRRQQRRLNLSPQPAGEDKISIALIVFCLFALGAVVAAQAGRYWNF